MPKKIKTPKENPRRAPVAHHSPFINKPAVHIDKKKEAIKFARLSVEKAPNESRKVSAQNLLAGYEK